MQLQLGRSLHLEDNLHRGEHDPYKPNKYTPYDPDEKYPLQEPIWFRHLYVV
jgi:hypothetical protein